MSRCAELFATRYPRRAVLDPAQLAPEAPRGLTRIEYHRMAGIGMFEGESVELLYGTIVTMSPHGPEHDETVNTLDEELARALGERARVRVQCAFAASADSEPEPDIAVVPPQSYRNAHPSIAWLIVEVARTSLGKDRRVKTKLYAESAVEEYWVVDLVDACVHVHREPEDGAYGVMTTHGRGDVIRMVHFPDVQIAVDQLLGPE